ncbi:hypothetical protein [Amycolatopsis ruanii]|uniref:hypothetical protein n=1 Tax=Amycolatopsis ruanii TaxID=944491 RepID=UPI0013BE91D1|nr:hypothetical protein [Amycolatopsis ruanii]
MALLFEASAAAALQVDQDRQLDDLRGLVPKLVSELAERADLQGQAGLVAVVNEAGVTGAGHDGSSFYFTGVRGQLAGRARQPCGEGMGAEHVAELQL